MSDLIPIKTTKRTVDSSCPKEARDSLTKVSDGIDRIERISRIVMSIGTRPILSICFYLAYPVHRFSAFQN